MSQERISQSEFARRCGVTRAAVSQGIRHRQIFREGKKINPDHPINKAYRERALKNNSGNRRDVKASKEAIKFLLESGSLEKLVGLLENKIQNDPAALKTTGDFKSGQAANESPGTQSQLSPDDIREKSAIAWAGNKKAEEEIHRAKAAKVNLELAEKMGELIRRKDVILFWRRVTGAMQNNILTIGERLAESVAAVCGVTDPVIVSEVRKKIDGETVAGMAMVKREADKFSFD